MVMRTTRSIVRFKAAATCHGIQINGKKLKAVISHRKSKWCSRLAMWKLINNRLLYLVNHKLSMMIIYKNRTPSWWAFVKAPNQIDCRKMIGMTMHMTGAFHRNNDTDYFKTTSLTSMDLRVLNGLWGMREPSTRMTNYQRIKKMILSWCIRLKNKIWMNNRLCWIYRNRPIIKNQILLLVTGYRRDYLLQMNSCWLDKIYNLIFKAWTNNDCGYVRFNL